MTRPGPLMFRTCRSRFPGPGAASVFALLPALLAAVPAAAEVGRTTAVVQQARGTPPLQTTRVLVPKLDLFENERIQTDDRGVTQILLLDGTNLTVGPNSDLVIDRFVYDPDTSAGEFAAELGRGVLRFVGGQISKRGRAAITTPVAVIGVRGGIAVVEHDEAGGTNAVLLFGSEMTVEGLGPRAETRRVTRPGFSVTVGSDGAVSNPERLPADRLESVLASLEGSEESDGGAPTRPTRDAVSRSEYAAARASDPGGDVPLDLAPAGEEVAETLAAEAAETLAADNPSALSHEDTSPALWRYRVGTENIDYGLPFLSSVSSSVYDLTIVKREGGYEVIRTGGYPFLRVRNQFSGQGANQVGAFFIYLGRITPNSDGLPIRFLGRFAGSARDATTSGSKGVILMWGNGEEDQSLHPTSAFDDSLPPESFHTAAGYTGFDGVFHPNDIRIQAHIDRSETTSPANVEWVLQDTVPLEQAGPRGDRTWHGYATALFEVRTNGALPGVFEGTYSLRNRNGSPEGVIFVADAETGRMGVVFRLGQVEDHELDQSDPSNAPDNFQVAEMEINFGRRPGQPLPPGVASISGTQGVYISDEAFAAVTSLGFDSNQENHRLILVNGQLVYQEHHATRTWMVSNDAAPAEDLLPSGVEYCDCPAAKFGWWGGHIGLFGGGPGGTREDAVFPGTFVVGELPDIADIPSQGTATYSGHAAAAVRNAGVAYAAVGGFEMDWDFATRTGEANITNLDGRDYTASDLVAPLTNARDFAGTFTQDGGDASGPIAGSFFTDGTVPVRDVGGQFTVEETGYTAVGSFAATQ